LGGCGSTKSGSGSFSKASQEQKEKEDREAKLPSTQGNSSETSSSEISSPSTPSCESLAEKGAQGVGSCEAPGNSSAKYAGVGHHLVLSGLSARYVSKETAPSVSSTGSTAKAHGMFVIVTLELTNHERSPQEWKSEQSSLLVGGNTYDEAFNAENGPDEHSLVWTIGGIGGKLQPEETRTGDVIYDVPSSVLHTLETQGGAVALRDFGEEHENKEAYGGVLLLPK
jgi:hypothetical protein